MPLKIPSLLMPQFIAIIHAIDINCELLDGLHQYVNSTFRFVGMKVWNYITDNINIQVSLPKFKKVLKTHIQSDAFTLNLYDQFHYTLVILPKLYHTTFYF